jgi:hypothetical protein
MFNRKEKENEFFAYHFDDFRKLKIVDPVFIIKTAFFQKGSFGRQVQLFERELNKGIDVYIEFVDVVRDNNNKEVDMVPMYSDRPLFKYKYNPYFSEEYAVKEGTNSKGEPYSAYVIPVSELVAVLKDGTEITYALYEKRRTEAEVTEEALPQLQKSVGMFPDFADDFLKKEVTVKSDDESVSDILLKIAAEFQKLAQKLN